METASTESFATRLRFFDVIIILALDRGTRVTQHAAMYYNRLREALAKRNLKMIEAAEAMGVHKTHISKWNVSGVPPKRLIDLEDKLGIPPYEVRPDIMRPPASAAEAA